MNKKYVLVLFVVSLFVNLLSASDYLQWRGVNRDGIGLESGLMDSWPSDGPVTIWKVNGIGTGYSSVIEFKGKIYITGMKDDKAILSAIEKESGKFIWQSEFGPSWNKKQYGGERCTPTYNDGKLYVLNPYAQLYCFNAADGKKIWDVDILKEYGARNITWGITESVVVDGNKVFVTAGAEDAAVIAFDKLNGKMIWKSKGSSKSGYCSPIVVDHNGMRMLITILENAILGLDVNSGEILWQVNHKVAYGINAVTPIYDDGICFVANGYKLGGKAFQISEDGRNAKEIWSEKKLDCHFGGLSYINGTIFGIGNKGNIFALDLKTGKQKGVSDPFVGKGALMAADGKFFCYGESGKVALVNFNGEKFSQAGIFTVTDGTKEHWAHPVVSNGVLYIRHGDYLIAYNVAK